MTIDFITEEKDYWVASYAINITLNALGDPNRIQCSVSSGAVVRCFYEHIDEADSLGYTVAHDYRQWPISSSPTYFNSDTEKYVYIAIPRSAAVGMQAVVVFPSDKLDIYGRKAVKSTDPETGEETIVYEQIGSTDYFYVWLQATISAPLRIGGVLQRTWTTQIATGKLDTPQGDAEREVDSEWYLWSAIGGFVTFLREIRMSADSWFANIRLGKNKHELTGVATADTADEFVDSETLVVTPSYMKKNTEEKFLRKDQDDATPYSLGVGGNLSVDGDETVGGDVDITGQERVDVVQSHNYSGSGLADTGFLITNDNGSGDSLGVFDYLTVRKKMIVNSLEIKETHFTAGDVAHTLASAEIARTDYFYVDENGNRELLGYSTILVPWSLKGRLLALAKGNLRGIFGHYKKVRLTLTQSQLERCNRIRCYFLAKDGDREVENWFRANDMARCQTWNVLKTKRETFIPNLDEHDGNVYWWRKIHDVSWNTGVTRYVAKDEEGNPTGSPTTNPANAYVNEGGVKRLYDNGIYHTKGTEGYDDHQPVTIDGNTYHWFDVDYNYFNDESVAAAGSDIPAAGDKVIQFGNTTDPDRMNIFMIEVNGAGNPDAPDWKMYRGVYTFDLTNCWWGGESCRKTKWSVATGIEAYAPQFKWITEYGIARQVFVRDEKYWNKIPFERDDDWSKDISSYPDYSDDIVDANGRFVSRADGSPKNYVRKCRYYEQVSHNGSAWLCSVVESFYWRSADGRKIPAKTDGAEYVRNYTYDEPSAKSNDWMEQVEKGDPGAFKSTVFCRSNSTPAAPSNDKKDGCNTFDNPIPPVVSGQPTWTDGIPDGTAILWASTAWFYSDGTHQDWTTPRPQTDTETLDIEFSPNATQPSEPYGTAASKDTASTKAQRHSQGWYDPNDTLPSGVTWSDMKWRAERKIKNGEYYGKWAITRIKGENSVRIDLDNENDSMLYTSGGTLVSDNVLSTARLFDGATDVSTSATWTMTAVGCTMSSGNSRNIVVTGMTAATGYVNVQAVYTDKNGTVYTKNTRLTLKKLVDVDKYDLDITPNSIAYNATKDQPATSMLTVKVWKMTVDGNRVLSNPPSGYGVYANNAKLTESSTGTYYYTTDNSAISSVQVKIAKDADLDAILDSETIPVNKAEDGAPGTSPYFADIDNEMDSVACDKNGKTLTAYDTTIGVSLWHGSHPLDITTLTTDSIQGFTITPDKTARTIRIQVPQGTSIAEVNKIGITIAGSGSGSLPLHFVLNGVRQGENGEPAVLYSLVPSVSSVVKKKDGTYSVDNVSCTRQKNVGGTITDNTTDGTITYKLDGGTEKSYTNNTNIAVSNFTKSIQFIFRVDNKVVDIETIPMVADGVDGVTPTVEIVGGYWVINGESTGVKAEGTDGTGVEIKGTVANPSKMTIRDGKGYAIPMNSDGSDAPEVEVKHGDCYICNSDRHLYMFTNTPAVAWNDLGEFQGKPGEDGKSSYMHIAYAKKNPLNVTTSTVDTIGFTVNSDGSQYEWMGFCTDDNESDPGRNWGSLSPSQKVAAVNAYKWNYMKGKDGSGYEYIYLLTKEGFKPTIDENSGQGSQSDDEFYPSVGNYQDGKIYGNSRYWKDDPPADISETWPVLWWASRKKSDGVWQAFGSVDLHNRYAKDGTSPWIADLDNEMDSVACDNDGKPVVQQTVSTNVSLFYGSQKKAFITSVNGGDTGITISFVNKTEATAKDSDTVTITFATNAVVSGKKEFEITLTAKDDASIQRVLTLTVNGLKGGATYNLVPSDSFVLLNKAKQYVPSVLTCTYNKFDVAKGQFVTPTDGTVKYIKDGETAENAYKQLVPGSDFTNNVTFLLYVGATLVDRETIHIVKDGTDGLSVQSYIETQEAWSNQDTTASADTMPSDCQEGDWKDSTPANTNSRTYLWRRSRKMTLKTDKSGYDAGQWTYIRLSGTNGTSIKTQGTVANTSKLLDKKVIPLVNGSDGQQTDVQDGWAYISEADRHLYQWSDELRSKSATWVDWHSGWLDLGEFKGESGKTYYTHIAWAKGIILKKDGDGRTVTTDRTAGQRTAPNAVYPMTADELENFDFSIAPQEDLQWMGTLVDEDTNDAADYKYYTWKYVQGADGKNAVRIDLDNQADLVSVDADGKVRFARTVVVRARIFDGAAMVTDDSKVSHSMTKASMKIGSREPSSIVKSNGVVTVQWDFSKGDSVTDQTKTFTLNYGGQGYSEEFTIGTTKSAVIYQLMPSPSEVSFSKGSDGKTLTPSQINLYGGYVKENGGAPVTVQEPNGSQIDSSNYLYYRIKGADGIWGAWTAYPASPNNFLRIASSTTNTDIEFCISTASDAGSVGDSNIVDRENVPIVKDGTDADDALYYVKDYALSDSRELTNGVPTIYGNWSETQPVPTSNYPYVWERNRLYNPNTGQYSNTTYVCLTGEDGPKGNDGVTVRLNPEDVLITQSNTKSGSSYPLVTVGNLTVDGTSRAVLAMTEVKVTEGETPKTNFVIGTPVPSKISGTTTNSCTVVKDDEGAKIGITAVGTITETIDGKSVTRYVDNGYVDVPITYNGTAYTVRLNFYCNLLGTWRETVEEGTRTIVAEQIVNDVDGGVLKGKTTYNYDQVSSAAMDYQQWSTDASSVAGSRANMNTRISTAEGNISRVESKITNSNLFTGVHDAKGWGDTNTILLTTVDCSLYNNVTRKFVSPDITLEAGTYTISWETNDNTQDYGEPDTDVTVYRAGTITQLYNDSQGGTGRMLTTFTLSAKTSIRVEFALTDADTLYRPKLEKGNTATNFDGAEVNYSEFKQTADGLSSEVSNNAGKISTLEQRADSITTTVTQLQNGKNLLSGVLTGDGWKSCGSTISFSGMADIEKVEDEWFYRNDGHSYVVSPAFNIKGGEKYTISFDADGSGRFAVIYDNNGTATTLFTGLAQGSGTRKSATIDNSADGSVDRTVYLLVQRSRIKHPQVELGSTATEFTASSVETSSQIKQTADNIQLLVKQGLSNTGIDITNGTIKLQANKVTFCDSNGGNTDKIWIDPTNGTLHAVDGHFSGEITATSGSIGGFGITGSQISSLNNNIILSSDGSATLGGFKVATNGTASLTSTLTVGNANSQRIEIIPFEKNQLGSGTINFINADGDKVLKIGFYNDNYGSIDLYSPATYQDPEECKVSVRSNYLQIYSENTDNAKESYITMLTSTNNAYSQYTLDDKVNKMFLTSGVEGGALMLRAHKQDGSSAWPVCSLDPNGANWMDKGHVHVMTMGELKVLLDNPSSIYSSHLANYAVMLTRVKGN